MLSTSWLDQPHCRRSGVHAWVHGVPNRIRTRVMLRFARLADRLSLTADQRRLFETFAAQIAQGYAAGDVPDASDGWQSAGPASDAFLRLEIAAGRFLGAAERARETFSAFQAALNDGQRRMLDQLMKRRWA